MSRGLGDVYKRQELDHCTGGHSIYKKEGVKKTLSIAYKKCNRMVVQRLIKEFGLVT